MLGSVPPSNELSSVMARRDARLAPRFSSGGIGPEPAGQRETVAASRLRPVECAPERLPEGMDRTHFPRIGHAGGLGATPGIQEAVLGYNFCVRTTEREALAPHDDHGELPLE